MSLTKKLLPLAVSAAIALPAAFVSTSAQAELTGNIGVHSQYLLRGIGVENEEAALQGGIDYSKDNFYAGWWASSLGYAYDSNGDEENGIGFENDFYGGFTGTAGSVNWDVGLIQYLYLNVDDSDLTELKAAASIGDFSAQMQYLLNDGLWGNAGDIYWTFGYGTSLPKGFDLGLSLGYYTYNDDDNSELYCGTNCTTNDSGFRNFNVTLSHAIGNTGADGYIQFTKAGDSRTDGEDFDDQIVLGITYNFDIK